MAEPIVARCADSLRLVGLSARLVAGRRYWLAPLLPLTWLAFQAFRLLVGWQERAFVAESAQTTLIGFPLVCLAIGLGVRVIAGEVDRRTLEIAYTVPGGPHRVWLAKLAASTALLVVSEGLLATVTFALFVDLGLGALYGALQAALVYLVLAMALAAWLKSEVTGAMATTALLALNGFITGFGSEQLRVSPFFNPLAAGEVSHAELLAWTVQNRIGFVLVMAALAALAFARAERREKLLA